MNHEHDLELRISCDIDSDIEDATYEHYLDVNPKRFNGGFGRMVIHW